MDEINNKYNNISNIKNIFNTENIHNKILDDKNKSNEINCIYIKKDDEIQLLYDYENELYGKYKKSYLEAKEINKKIFEENMELYIDGNKTKFNYIYI